MPASVLLDRLALAMTEGVSCVPAQRSRHRAAEAESVTETTRKLRPVGVPVYGAAAVAVSVIGGAAAATASFGSGVVTDVGGMLADLSVASPQAAAPDADRPTAHQATESITQIIPAASVGAASVGAASVGAAAPVGADLPTAQASEIAASVLDGATKVQSAVQAAAPVIAKLPAQVAPAKPAQAAPAKAPAQAISLGSPTAAKAMSTAMSKIGKPYVWGAAGPNAFDCSGLVQWAYKQLGVSLPHSSAAQSKIGTPVAKGDLRPGDLVFFYSPVSHVGIYVGNGKVLNASESGQPVKLSTLANMPFHNARRL